MDPTTQTQMNPNQTQNASAEIATDKIEKNFTDQNITNQMMMNPENPEDMTVTSGGESKTQSTKKDKKKEIPTHTHACYGGCCGHQVTTRKLKPFKFQGHKGRAVLRQICVLKYHYRAIYNALGNACEYKKFTDRIAFMTDMFCDMYNHSKDEINEYINHHKTKRLYTTADRNYYQMQYELCPDQWGISEELFNSLPRPERIRYSPFKQDVGDILRLKDGTPPYFDEPDWVAYKAAAAKKKKAKPERTQAELIAALCADAMADIMAPTPVPELDPVPVAEVEPVAEAKDDMPEAKPEKKKVPRGRMENNEKTRRILRHIFPEPEYGELPDRYTGVEFKSIRIVKMKSKHTGNKYTMYLYPRNPTGALPYIKKPIDAATFERYYEMKPIKIKKAKK